MEKLVKSHQKLTLFLADFSHLKTSVRPPPTAQNMHYSFCSSAFYACIPEDFILAHNLIILGTIVHQKRFYFGRQLRSLLCAFAMEKNREGIIEVSRYQIQFKNFSANSASNPRLIEWQIALSYFKRSLADRRLIIDTCMASKIAKF